MILLQTGGCIDDRQTDRQTRRKLWKRERGNGWGKSNKGHICVNPIICTVQLIYSRQFQNCTSLAACPLASLWLCSPPWLPVFGFLHYPTPSRLPRLPRLPPPPPHPAGLSDALMCQTESLEPGVGGLIADRVAILLWVYFETWMYINTQLYFN